MLRSLRSAGHWLGLRHEGGVRVSETRIPASDGPARVIRIAPRRSLRNARPLPVWIAQHGVTTLGPDHPAFQMFVRGIAASGAVVFLPEFAPWTQFDLTRGDIDGLLRGTIRAAADDPLADHSRLSLLGISFGGSQALVSAGRPGIREHVRHVVTFGAYHSLESLMRFQITGEIPGRRRVRRVRPDPYALWLTALHLMPGIEGLTDTAELQQVMRSLLMAGSQLAVTGNHPGFDPLKRELGRRLGHADRGFFEFLAPVSTAPWPVAGTQAVEWSTRVLDAARRDGQRFEPMSQASSLPTFTTLVHGRGDLLIPPSESRALLESLRPFTNPSLLLTGVVEHSQRARARSLVQAVRQWIHLFAESNRVLSRV